jgi:aldose 1-epimerase
VLQRLCIAAGDSICEIAPAIGGSIASWMVDGQPMLRTAAPDATHATGMASFPLVPFSNRIGNARFEWQGRDIALPSHPAALPHAHHGIGWERAWTISDAQADHLDLALDHPGDAFWPWPFRAVQQIHITEDSLILMLSATNLADETAPLAFAHHPYFDAAGAELSFVAGQFYRNAPDGLPLEPIAPTSEHDFVQWRSVTANAIDNLYGDWLGMAHIRWAERPYALNITSTLPHAVLYTPHAEDYFCFEPVPHLTNALNRADCDMPVIAPGEAFHAQISLSAIPN